VRSQIVHKTGSRICDFLVTTRETRAKTEKRIYYISPLHVNDYRGYHASIITYFCKMQLSV